LFPYTTLFRSNEPDHVFARPGMHQRGTHHPQDLAAATLLLAEPLRQHGVVDGLLARHLGLHEPELVGTVRAAEETLGMHEDALAAVLLGAHRDELALAHPAGLGHDEIAARVQHHHAVHAGQARPAPDARR